LRKASHHGIAEDFKAGRILDVVGRLPSGGAPGEGTGPAEVRFQVKARVDTPLEIECLKNGGVLNYVLRNFMAEA
jgi:aconitate hydratase